MKKNQIDRIVAELAHAGGLQRPVHLRKRRNRKGGAAMKQHIDRIVAELAAAERKRLAREYPNIAEMCRANESFWLGSYAPKAVEKREYWNIDIGTSAAWMVEKSTGNVFGVKGYGAADRRKYMGPVHLIEGKDLIRYRYCRPTCRVGCGIPLGVPGPAATPWNCAAGAVPP